MRIFIFILTLSSFVNVCLASTYYFDFEYKALLIPHAYEFEIEIVYNFANASPDDFRIKPVSDKGAIYIYHDDRESWVSGNELWINMPVLKDKMKLRISKNVVNSINIGFQILDAKTYVIYETPFRNFWTWNIYDNYVNNLNTNIRRFSFDSSNKEVRSDATNGSARFLFKVIKYIDEIFK